MKTKAINSNTLGIILRSARKSKGLNQTEAGKLVGVDQTTISKVERGESKVRIDTLFRIQAALAFGDNHSTQKNVDRPE